MNTHQKLNAARQRLAEIEREIAALGDKRKAMLMADDRAEAIVATDKEIMDLKTLAQIEADRVAGLGEEIRRQEVAAVIRRKEATIGRLEKKLHGTVDLARELEATIGKAVEIFHRIVRIRGEVQPMFQLGDPEVSLAVDNPDGAALTGGSVATLLKYELYRQGARPWGTVAPGLQAEPSFPGGVPPRVDLQLTPDKITPLSTALANATRYAVGLMRSGRAPALLAEQPADEPRTPAQMKLAELLARQAALAEDQTPEGEAAYRAVVQEIIPLQDQVEAERQAIKANVAAAERSPETRTPAEVRLDELRKLQVSMVERGVYSAAEYTALMREIAPLAERIEAAGQQGAHNG